MENWIAQRIRVTARRRFAAWTLVLIIGALAATSDHRYIANFFSGPYLLAQADLDAIGRQYIGALHRQEHQESRD
jgi:hypothetical protein